MSLQNLYTKMVSNILFPMHERLKGHSTVAVHEAMEKIQWQTPAVIRAAQDQRLRAFLDDVGAHVPYYRNLFQHAGITPGAIQNAADLGRLPLLTKPLIRQNSDELCADDAQSLARFNTGGSSGEPLVFYISKERVSHDVAAKWRATRWWGVDIGDKELVVWGSPIELGGQDYIKGVRDKILRTRLLPAFEMTEAKIDQFIEEIQRVRPAMLFGYPSALSLIAARARDKGMALDQLGIRVAFVTSEKLYDHQREIIEAVFRCPVANGYGGRDAGFIAHQCPQGSMHITSDDIIVEIIDRDGNVVPDGQSGEIVITHLATRDYPFIRYRTGDIGVLATEPCSCGRGLPVLKDIQGRSTDFIVAQDGTIMHGLALIYIIRDLESIEQFKIIQKSMDETTVEIVANDQFNDQDRSRIERGFKQRLGELVKINVKIVQSIEPEASGKTRYVISHVESGAA